MGRRSRAAHSQPDASSAAPAAQAWSTVAPNESRTEAPTGAVPLVSWEPLRGSADGLDPVAEALGGDPSKSLLVQETAELAAVANHLAGLNADASAPFGAAGFAELRAAGLRVETDLRNEKINYKVREHSVAKVPVLLVVGKREADEGNVAVRRLGSQGQEIVTLADITQRLTEEARAPDLAR